MEADVAIPLLYAVVIGGGAWLLYWVTSKAAEWLEGRSRAPSTAVANALGALAGMSIMIALTAALAAVSMLYFFLIGRLFGG